MPRFQNHTYYYPGPGLKGEVNARGFVHIGVLDVDVGKHTILCGKSDKDYSKRKTIDEFVILCPTCEREFKPYLASKSKLIDSWV